jgi:molybdopterin synthase sulfur carrier subunit
MVEVHLWATLKTVTGGLSSVEVEAKTIKEIFSGLEKQFPALKPYLDKGLAVSIDGEIYQDAWFKKVSAENEIHLMPRFTGG